MVNVSQDIINSFNEGNLQTAVIEFSNGSQSFTITEADIIQGGLKIDRYCATNNKIEIGSAVASELSLKLRNYDGKFDDVSFEGAVLNVKIGVKLSSFFEGATLGKGILGRMILGQSSSESDTAYIPCGLFIVDTPPRKLQTINLSALDYMVKFDKEVNPSAISFPIHVDALIQRICAICGVSLSADAASLPNHYFSIGGLPATNQTLTYRQLLQWCAQMTGTCAFFDGNGRLVLKWYEQTGVTITANERYSSDMLENDIKITGFTCKADNSSVYLAGTNEYTLDLSDCGFLTNSQEGVLKELLATRGGFSYRPYSATIKPAPYLFPMDMIHYKDKFGVVHDTIVTNVTLALNCNTAIAGAGETVTSSSYAQTNSGVTNQQAIVNLRSEEKVNQNTSDLTKFREEYSSDLQKTNEAIKARVTKTAYQEDMTGVSERIGKTETSISQNATAIELRVTKEEYTGQQIVSKIEQTADDITISAKKINLEGAVTTEDISADGLDAKVIKAGTITATEIKADTITAGNMATGSAMTLLWKNSSSNSTFAPQELGFENAMQYSKFMIKFVGYKGDDASATKLYYSNSSIIVENAEDHFLGGFAPFVMFINWPKAYITYDYTSASSLLNSKCTVSGSPHSAHRPFSMDNDTDTQKVGFLFFNASTISNSGSMSVNNDYMIPTSIWGLK